MSQDLEPILIYKSFENVRNHKSPERIIVKTKYNISYKQYSCFSKIYYKKMSPNLNLLVEIEYLCEKKSL